MAKKSSLGLGTLVAAAAGALAGAVGVFLSDKENRQTVVREAKKVERVIEKDLKKARATVKKTSKKVQSTVKKAAKSATKRKSR